MKVISQRIIENKIFIVRGNKIIFDKDLAKLYEVTTSALIQAVKRNPNRFPNDFMFQLTKEEFMALKSHFVISNRRGGTRKLPFAFTEHGILMLSSVLNSEKAVAVNIEIMRIFSRLRELMIEHRDLKEKIEEIENKYNYQFRIVFEKIKKLLNQPKKRKNPIGFHVH